MYTMTFTNTLRKTGEVLTQQVVVASEQLGKDLIDKWNRASTLYCLNSYHYDFVKTMWTGVEDPKLGVFTSLNNYHHPVSQLHFRG